MADTLDNKSPPSASGSEGPGGWDDLLRVPAEDLRPVLDTTTPAEDSETRDRDEELLERAFSQARPRLQRRAALIASLTKDSIITSSQAPAASGKADRLVVNRQGKGDLIAPASLPVMKQRVSSFETSGKSSKVARSNNQILLQGVRPLSFE